MVAQSLDAPAGNRAGLLIAGAVVVVAVRALPALKGQAHDDRAQTATAVTLPAPPGPRARNGAARTERTGEGVRQGGARDEDRGHGAGGADRIIIEHQETAVRSPGRRYDDGRVIGMTPLDQRMAAQGGRRSKCASRRAAICRGASRCRAAAGLSTAPSSLERAGESEHGRTASTSSSCETPTHHIIKL